MSVVTDDVLNIELQIELELLQTDHTIVDKYDDNIDINDIFSSNEGDYKLFELNNEYHHTTTDIDENENDNIWQSYYDKIHIEQEKYLTESQNILSQMKQTCADTLKICDNATKKPLSPSISQSNPNQSEFNIIYTEITHDLQSKVNVIKISQHQDDEEPDIITQDPHIPSHVNIHPNPPLILPPNTQVITSMDNSKEETFIQRLIEENIQTFCDSLSPSKSSMDNINDTSEKHKENDYQKELQKLENELREVTQAHEEELQIMDSNVSWAILLQESKELYDEYMKTTEKIKRDKQRLIMIKCFNTWKNEWYKTGKEKLRLIKVIFLFFRYLFSCYVQLKYMKI